MAVPQFLSVAYRYLKLTAVTDVQTIIDNVYAELIANLWTCTAGGSGLTPTTMLSPLRADRLRLSITLTRTSATQLTLSVADDLGLAVTKVDQVLEIAAGGNEVYLCTGAYFCYIASHQGSPIHLFVCGVLDNAPYASLAEPRPAYFATGNIAFWEDLYTWAIDLDDYDASYREVKRFNNWTSNQSFISLSGAYMFCPAEIMDVGEAILLGRLPQIVLLEDSIADFTELIVPIDTGVTGTFVVVCSGYHHGKIAIRKA